MKGSKSVTLMGYTLQQSKGVCVCVFAAEVLQ